jgi:hypothetical protein
MPMKGVRGLNRQRQMCSKGLHPMYTVPNDPNVMQTSDGDRCRACWMLADATRQERRRQKSALRKAAKDRLRAIKATLGRPAATAAHVDEMTEAKACILRGQVDFLKKNPAEDHGALAVYQQRLAEWDARRAQTTAFQDGGFGITAQDIADINNGKL